MVEMLIAIGVFLVAVVAAFSSQLASMGVVSTSRETSVAGSELQAAMEEMLVLQLQRIPRDFPAGQEIPRYAGRNLQDERIVPTYPGLTDLDDPPNPLQIVLELSWSDGAGRTRTSTLATTKAR